MDIFLKKYEKLEIAYLYTSESIFFIFLSIPRNKRESLMHQIKIIFNPKLLEINTLYIFYRQNNLVNSAWIKLCTPKKKKKKVPIYFLLLHLQCTRCVSRTISSNTIYICFGLISHKRLPKNLNIGRKFTKLSTNIKKQFQHHKICCIVIQIFS